MNEEQEDVDMMTRFFFYLVTDSHAVGPFLTGTCRIGELIQGILTLHFAFASNNNGIVTVRFVSLNAFLL